MERTIYWFVNSMEQEAQELARGLRRRDPDLLDRLIERYHYRLFRYLLMLVGSREAAEDLFQETWIRVLEKGHQYRVQWKFETWLFSIARNLAIDLLRRRRPQSLDELLESEEGMSARNGPPHSDASATLDAVSRREDAQWISDALAQLPAASREVLVLRFQEDLDLSEIAEVVQASLATVKSRLYRGLESLRGLLGSCA
jgi:RNA polymerase sigma-70 factor (ECF subfamily)